MSVLQSDLRRDEKNAEQGTLIMKVAETGKANEKQGMTSALNER
jgi:hypothetical protein